MKKDADACRKISRLLICALTGQTRIHVTIAAYSAIALLLLGYVSAQIYTTVLAQGIVERKAQRQVCKERLSKLTSDYVALTSRARVTEYCEDVLGMRQATDKQFQRFAVRSTSNDRTEPIDFTRRYAPAPDPLRFSLNRDLRMTQE